MDSTASYRDALVLALKNALRSRIGNDAADEIRLEVDGDHVTVSGPVRSWDQRDTIIEVVRSAPGVLLVRDRVHLRGYRIEW